MKPTFIWGFLRDESTADIHFMCAAPNVSGASGAEVPPEDFTLYNKRDFAIRSWQEDNKDTTGSLKARSELFICANNVIQIPIYILLDNVPVELWNAITRFVKSDFEPPFGGVASGTAKRRMISRPCLVSKEMCRALRPLLFQQLTVTGAQDIVALRRILRSEVSGWLANHIEEIVIVSRDHLPQATSLLPRVHGLQKVSYRYVAQMQFPIELRPRLAALRSLRCIGFRDVMFPSFSALCHLLGSIRGLEEVDLYKVE